ncbi:MAG: pentapeptide repeat-containing protein [Streptosporangiaceae bacterium]
MAGRSAIPSSRGKPPREPTAPSVPDELSVPVVPAAVGDEASYVAMLLADLDLSGRSCTSSELDQCRCRGVDLSRTALRRVTVTDTAFERCDLANLRARDCSLRRVSVHASRMTGLVCLDGRLRDVSFTECQIDLASFRASRFTDVLFSGCRLRQADFGDADLSGARFENCDLTGASFNGAKMTGTRLRGCELAGLSGVTSLRGAILTSADAVALALTLAGALGIRVEDEDP